jgi:hypothetical protein
MAPTGPLVPLLISTLPYNFSLNPIKIFKIVNSHQNFQNTPIFLFKKNYKIFKDSDMDIFVNSVKF